MMKFNVLLMLAFIWGFLTGSAQTFKFKQVKPDNLCLELIMENITKIVDNSYWLADEYCHYLSITVLGNDTLLDIRSFDTYGIYSTLTKHKYFGVCLMYDHEFYIDSSLFKSFYFTGDSFKKRYSNKFLETNKFTINDCYSYWIFRKEFCGIDLDRFSYIGNFKSWYDLDLNTDCFCDYKKLTIDIIEEDPEDLNDD